MGLAVLAALVSLGVLPAGPARGQDLPDPQPDPVEVRERAQEILAQDEYAPSEPSVLDRIFGWLGDRLADLFEGGTGTGSGSPVVGYLVVAGTLGGLGYLLFRWLRRVQPEADLGEPVGPPDESSTRPDEWRRAAERFEADERWKDALRCRYRVLVSELVDQEMVDDVPGRTAGEYRIEVARGLPGAAPPFDRATELFELAWYADEATGPDENRQIRSLTDDVLARAR